MNTTMSHLQARIGLLESKNDQLETELTYLNEILIRCGFTEGVKTLKETAEELLAEDSSLKHHYEKPELI